MKKVLSVALASAMVLGMGVSSFAISYNSGSNNEADWPENFRFDGELFVTNKDGDIITDATTALNDNESVDFEPGDVIWMPLYADHQKVYDSSYTEGKDDIEAQEQHKVVETSVDVNENWWVYVGQDTKVYSSTSTFVANSLSDVNVEAGYHGLVYMGTREDPKVSGKTVKWYAEAKINGIKDYVADTAAGEKQKDVRYYIGAKEYKDYDAWVAALTVDNANDGFITVKSSKVEGTDDEIGKPIWDGTYEDDVIYTGNIDKNWSINLIEKSSGVAELIEKAELYKATTNDYHSYKDYTDEITPNGVYLKITLKDEWKTVDEETLTYYVYVADNDNKNNKTNEVWVSGTYVNNDWEYVDFTWTNNAAEAQLWKVKKGENGTAVFDFADKAFFTVKMYSGESMYLDLSTAYDKAIAGEMDAEADSFYKFDNENANFSRTGELIIVTNDSSLVPYEIDEDGNFVEVDAKYVEDYAIAHTNKKVDGFVFNTKTLGNYVLSTEELGQEEKPVEETPAEPVTPSEPTQETPAPETSKPNPDTGAEDFVGLAVSLAVVSVAAAGALALKK